MTDDAPKPLVVLAKKPAQPVAPVGGVSRHGRLPELPARRLAKLAAALAVAGLVAYVSWPRGGATASAVVDGAAVGPRIAPLDVAARFPDDGWHYATRTDAAPIVTPHAKTALVVRGPAADPDDQAFFATLPLAGALADAAASDARLLAVARDAERGPAAHLAAAHATYYSEGCTKLGPRAARCRGTVTTATTARTIVTHVRLGATRAVIALFASRAPRDAEVDAIAASLQP